MRALVIVNPVAGRGRARQIGAQARDVLAGAGYRVTVEETWGGAPPERFAAASASTPGPATAIARVHRDGTDRVVVLGGDGTLREAVEGLGAGSRVPIALVPLGNGNVIAQELALPDPRRGVGWIAGDATQALDGGRCNGALFLAIVSCGYDALIARAIDAVRRSSLGGAIYRTPGGGDLLYALAGTAALARVWPLRFDVAIDGVPLAWRPASVWVSNTRSFAKGLTITPDASPHDGLLDVQACRRAGPIAPVRVLLAAWRRRRAPESLSVYATARSVRITAERAFGWQADGDVQAAVGSLDVEVVPAAWTAVLAR